MMMSSYDAKILLVDDSAVLRKLAVVTLGGIGGFRIDEAEDAGHGLELASSQHYDAVVTDFYMPGIDGIEFIRLLRKRDEYRKTPLVLLTSESDESVAREARLAGANDVVVKPFEPSQMRGVLKELLSADRRPVSSRTSGPIDAQALLDSMPYPAMVLDADHNVVMGNQSFWQTTNTGIADCAVVCAHAMHADGEPANCPLTACVRSGSAVETEVCDPGCDPLLVSVYPMDQTDESGGRLYLHLARPLG